MKKCEHFHPIFLFVLENTPTTIIIRKCLYVLNSFSRDPGKVVRPRIPLTTCIKNFAKDDVIDGFYSTALERKSVVRK
jgi:uncharacterized Fe-S cluster-containing protein